MLFVPEDDPNEVHNDDPVISSIPLYLNSLPESIYPLLVQSKSIIPDNSVVNYKPESSVIEVQTPLSTNKFFSEEQAQNLGSSNKSLKGVIINNNDKIDQDSSIRFQPGTLGGSEYFVLLKKDDGLHMTSVPNTVVLNPDFNHIDEAKSQRLQNQTHQQQQQQVTNTDKNNNGGDKKVNVVTMSAKSSKEIFPRLGGALLSSKLEMEEEPIVLKINSLASKSDFICKDPQNTLSTPMTQEDYLDSLLEQS